jgi:flagellar biosynthetic protein FlhB
VLAKGRNLLAEEIKAEARWAGVPIVENPPLARSLYRHVEVGQTIPVDLYAAVAAILAYLYRQRVETEMRERRAREAQARASQQAARASEAARVSEAARRSRPGQMPEAGGVPPDRGGPE